MSRDWTQAELQRASAATETACLPGRKRDMDRMIRLQTGICDHPRIAGVHSTEHSTSIRIGGFCHQHYIYS